MVPACCLRLMTENHNNREELLEWGHKHTHKHTYIYIEVLQTTLKVCNKKNPTVMNKTTLKYTQTAHTRPWQKMKTHSEWHTSKHHWQTLTASFKTLWRIGDRLQFPPPHHKYEDTKSQIAVNVSVRRAKAADQAAGEPRSQSGQQETFL